MKHESSASTEEYASRKVENRVGRNREDLAEASRLTGAGREEMVVG